MPVFRSREITPVIKSKTPGKALDIGAFEPDTPAKTGEGLNEMLNVSPLTPNWETVGLVSGAVQRRSARLASKSNLGLTEVLEDMNWVGVGAVVQETRLEANDSASSADLGTLGWSDDRVESIRKGQRKRKLGTDILLGLEHAGQGESEKRFLNLRSGKKIVKIDMKREAGDSYDEIETNVHGDLDSRKQNGSILVDSGANGGTRNRSETDAIDTDYVTFMNGRKFSREEKGKANVLEKVSDTRAVGLAKLELDFKEVDGSKAAVANEMCVESRSIKRIDKGKEILVDNDISSKSISVLGRKSETRVDMENGRTALDPSDSESSQDSDHITEVIPSLHAETKRSYQERFRDIAKRNASRFAHFSSQVEEEEDNGVVDDPGRQIPPPQINGEIEDWPGPFSTAMKIIRDRQANATLQQRNSSDKRKAASVLWIPKKDKTCNLQKKMAPSLQDLCLSILVTNADAISSLECVPDVLRHKLSYLLCNSRRMDSHFLDLLVHGSPTEIHLRDCSWLTEDDFTRAFERCDVSNLTVLQLDQCGRCLPDYILSTTLAHSPKSLPALASLSLKGAYRFSDAGISILVSSAPALRSINLSQCSLLTSDGICSLAASLGSVLRELYIDDCQGIDAMLILRALLKIDNLEVLSLAGIETVSDDFIGEFASVQGHKMKELVLANCMKLTDSCLRVISETCPKLCVLDLSNLCKLTDAAIAYLANGCRAIQNLKLCRNTFSDEAVAAYLEMCGDSLKELSLSNVIMVAQNTAMSLARHSRNLNSLDLSWCRNLTDEALGLIVDSCSSLKVLKVFGCTQITNVFLSGHSNPEVEIIGLKMKPILEHLNSPDFLQGPLRYSFYSCPV